MEVSVIISTYNRSYNLPECIDYLARQEKMLDFDWEIVVVDNNSTDDTAMTVQRLAKKCPIALRYVREQQQGLSHARNRGIRETDSKYLVFIDDDIRVSPRWLRSIYDTFEQQRCDAVGGRIHVDSPKALPSWISPEMYGFLGHRDFGETPFQMDGVEQFPFGGNMAFQRRVIHKIGFFNTDMGRKGSGRKREHLFKGEETDYSHRLAKAGGTFYYQPSALVRHKILPYQLEKRFFRIIHFNAGYQEAIHDQSKYCRTLCGVPLFVFLQTARAMGRYLHQLLMKGPDYAFRYQMTVGYFLGMIRGHVDRN